MYVKVVDRDHNAVPSSEIHDTNHAPVSTGTFWFDKPPEQQGYHAIANAHFVYVFDVDPNPTHEDHEHNLRQWMVRYAFWSHPETGLHLLVTNGQIYVMSDAGATIDRVA